ncbi:hypothetical protein JOE11_004941 [Robbsia andropogonis]|uniref:Lar family restriction alleviation protein n=1 Tax=Robbsia andropogonis TaxID=28092 RepID=UPI003D1D387C
MIAELIPCPSCAGMPKIGRSQRLAVPFYERRVDYRIFGDFGYDTAPENGDSGARPPGMPETIRLRNIHCADCGMATAWEDLKDGEAEIDVLERVGRRWNTRVERPKYSDDDVRALIDREVGVKDEQLVLAMMATTDDDQWELRGPVLKAAALRILDATLTGREYWPIEPTLEDAARFRKITQLVKMVTVDGVPSIQFPCLQSDAAYTDFAWEARVARTVDDLPDRDRW